MPGFIGGLAQGLQGLPEEIGQLQQIERAKKVAAAMLAANTGGGPQPGQTDPVAALAALRGGGPAPMAAGPQPAPAPPAARPAAAPPAAPQPLPGQPTGQPGAEAPTGMAVAPGLSDPVKEGQSIIHNLWLTTKALNPKADPYTIMKAVEAQLDEIKGVAPVTKAMMQGQLQYMNYSMKAQQFDEREGRLRAEHAQKMLELAQHHANQDEIAAENARFRGAMVEVARMRADYYGESVQYTHEDRQDTNKTRLTVAQLQQSGMNDRAALKEAGLSDRAVHALAGKRGSAMVAALGKIESTGAQITPEIVDSLAEAYDSGGQAPAPARSGGGSDAAAQAWAKKNGLTLVRKRKDGGWDARDGKGNVGVVHPVG